MTGLPGGTATFIAVSIVAFIVLGSVLEGIPAIVLFGPLLFPIARAVGVHEVHYASYALLDEADRAVLRRISVFAAPFTATAAEAMLAGWPPTAGGAIPAALARLADQSLLVAAADPAGTRYRALETIRQYGAAQLDRGGRG